jgi:xylose isomerase
VKEKKVCVGIWAFGNLRDRFVDYKDSKSVIEMIKESAEVEEIKGVEFLYPDILNEDNARQVNQVLTDYNLEMPAILVNTYADRKWQYGSLSAADKEIREKAKNTIKRCMDLAHKLGTGLINLCLCQDGFDYLFQADYQNAWKNMMEELRECAEHDSDIKIGIEYKQKEPRTHNFIGTVGKTLLVVQQVGKENVGVTLDGGHALYAYENLAESSVLSHLFGNRLFHLHLNDSYGVWDDDMYFGSVRTLEHLELFYWLVKINYEGWYGIDIYPYREDPKKAVEESIKTIEGISRLLDKIGISKIEQAIKGGNPVETLAIIREKLLP